MSDHTTAAPPPSLVLSLLPVLALIGLLAVNVSLFGGDASGGANQIVLIACGALAAALAMGRGQRWRTLQKGVEESIGIALPSILILLLIGALAGAWLVGGIVPTMIYYGLQILNPSYFLLAAAVICALVSLIIGSSWTTVATMGISLMAIGKALGLSEAMIAGAVISGSYFGDKMSPVSDTTSLAPGVAGTDIFTHIRYMMITNVPSISLALVLYLLLGLFLTPAQATVNVDGMLRALEQTFFIHPLLLLVPGAVVAMIIRKTPAIPAIFVGILLGLGAALLCQPQVVAAIGGNAADATGTTRYYMGLLQALYGDTAIATGNTQLDGLMTSGGMMGMLGTIWLILSAMVFGGVMEASGMLHTIAQTIMRHARSAASLISSTAATCLFVNTTASDQYLAIVIPGRMFAPMYRDRNLAPENLSRTLEDAGTVTSPLIPWNTCGAYHMGVLGVSALAYAPFAFFCLISPLMTMLVAHANFKIRRL